MTEERAKLTSIKQIKGKCYVKSPSEIETITLRYKMYKQKKASKHDPCGTPEQI